MSVASLEADMAAAFPPCPADDFAAMATQALAGEYFGDALFAALVEDAERDQDRALWNRMRRVESATIACLEPMMARHGLPQPPRAPLAALGARAAAAFPGARHEEFCSWVAPQVPPALESFRSLLALCEAPEDKAACSQLVHHELAIAQCLDRLDDGIEIAAAALDAHLAEVERIPRRPCH